MMLRSCAAIAPAGHPAAMGNSKGVSVQEKYVWVDIGRGVWPMGLMGRRVGCLRATSPNGNMRDQEVLRTVASEVLSEDQAPVCAVARAAIATCCRG